MQQHLLDSLAPLAWRGLQACLQAYMYAYTACIHCIQTLHTYTAHMLCIHTYIHTYMCMQYLMPPIFDTCIYAHYYSATAVLLQHYYSTITYSTITVLLQYYYSTTTILLQYYYSATTILLQHYYSAITVLLQYYYYYPCMQAQ